MGGNRALAVPVLGMLLAAAVAAAGERVVLEAILVRVNDRILTVTEFRRRLEVELSQYPTPPVGDALNRFARQLFESLVDELVLLERAEEKRLTVDEEMVDNAIQSLRDENSLQDDAAFEQALQGAGLTVDQLRNRYRQTMLLQRAAQSETTPVEITEQELRQRYETDKEGYRVPAKVVLEQVFFPIASDGSDREDVARRARGLVSRVRAGSDLKAEATLAGLEVQDLGAIPPEDLRPDLQRELEVLATGEITDPLETGGGFQVIRMVDRLEATYQPFEEVRESIRRRLSMEAYEQQTRGVVERLKDEYLVEIHEDRLMGVIEALRGAA